MESRTSKSKTFQKGDDFGQLYEWLLNQLETEDREIITVTPPDYDVRTELIHKYLVTITKIENNGE